MLERPFFVLLRGIILLAAVILIPLAAIFWKGIPTWFDKVTEAIPQLFGDAESSDMPEAFPDLPLKAQEVPVATSQSTAQATRDFSPQMLAAAPQVPYAAAHSSRTSPVRELYPDRPLPSDTSYAPMSFSAAQSTSGNNAVGNNANVSLGSQQQSLVAELERLGAQYYRLEKWGTRGELYRLSCLVSPPGISHYQKHFQTVDEDCSKALINMIEQITRWHSEKR